MSHGPNPTQWKGPRKADLIPSYYGFYDIAWTPLPVPYTAEILPFGLRTKGLALFTSVGTMANSFNQFVNPIALQTLKWK